MIFPHGFSINITFQVQFLVREVLQVVDHRVETDQVSVVDVSGVDVGRPAVLRVELVVEVDPPSVKTNSQNQPGPAGTKERDLR